MPGKPEIFTDFKSLGFINEERSCIKLDNSDTD